MAITLRSAFGEQANRVCFPRHGSQELYMDPANRDYDELARCLSSFRRVRAMVARAADLRAALDDAHSYAFPLMRWIITR